jgi:H+-transporting ATPase
VGISLVLCFIAFGYMLAEKEPVKEALQFTVVLLIASIPVAIEIVVTATLALGSRQLSEHGAIVTRLTAIEEMAGMNMLCSDKTGTLTLNKMVIQVRAAPGWRCLAAHDDARRRPAAPDDACYSRSGC